MSDGSIEDLEVLADEGKYNNFAATSTTNYMTTSRNHNPTAMCSSDSSSITQPSIREYAIDDKELNNGNGNRVGISKTTARLLRMRKVTIVRQKKRIAALEKDSERYKALIVQIYKDGILTELYKEKLEAILPGTTEVLNELLPIGD